MRRQSLQDKLRRPVLAGACILGMSLLLNWGIDCGHAQSLPGPPTQPPPTAASATSVDAATRKEIVEALAQKLTDDYALAEPGAKAAQAMRAKFASGAYDKITSPEEFARALHKDLREQTLPAM